MKKAFLAIGGAAFVLAVLAFGTVLFKNPLAISTVCPQCFGFRILDGSVYAEGQPSMPLPQLVAGVRAAQHQVEDFFKSPIPPAKILICTTETCYRRVEAHGGGSKAVSWFDRALLVSPRGLNVTIMAHELTHIEFRHLLGIKASATIPAWFDEGLAVYVADDRRYLAPVNAKNRCLVSGADALPTTNGDWWGAISHAPAHAYALAACRVATWMAEHGGQAGLLNLIGKVRGGQDFQSALISDGR